MADIIKDDFIKRSDIGLTDFEIFMCDGDYKVALELLLKKIESIPSADVQPVVRCKDCKYHATGADYTDDFGEPLDKAMMCLGIRYGGVDPDWFCEHGERMETNNE